MLNIVDRGAASAKGDAPADEGTQFEIARLVSAIERERRIIIAWIAALVAIGLVYLLLATPLFKAEAVILIDMQTSRTLEKADVNTSDAPAMIDTSLVDSQVEILASNGLALEVVHALHLTTDPEFVGPKSGLLGWVGGAVSSVLGMFSDGGSADDPEQRAVEAFGKNLTVKRTGLTYVITITFWSQSPTKAARIANTIADVYLRQVLEAKYSATNQTGKWLQDRLAELRSQATDAATAVENFKNQNNIIDTSRGLMNEQQLGELNSQLALAAAATAETGARLAAAREVMKDPLSGRTTAEALNNSVFSRLRAQYLDLETRAGYLEERFGPQHRAAQNLRKQMSEVKKAASNQLTQIVNADENDYHVAVAREESLRKSLNDLIVSNDQTGLAQVQLKQIKSNAESIQSIYSTYLQKYQELIQRSSFPVSDARIVSSAVSPLKKSSPRGSLILGGGVALGLFLGIAHIFLREIAGDKFTFLADVPSATGLPCFGFLPTIEAYDQAQLPAPRARIPLYFSNHALLSRVIDAAAPAFERLRNWSGFEKQVRGPALTQSEAVYFVKAFPHSRFAETLWAVKVAVDSLPREHECKVIGVCSAIPGEGKTTVAANLGLLLASWGAKVLLIDTDFSTHTLTDMLAPGVRTSLGDVLDGRLALSEAVSRSTDSTLEVLASAGGGRIGMRAKSAHGGGLARLLEQARSSYDYIILDTPPIVPLVDVQMVAPLTDTLLLVIKWGATSRKVVSEAVRLIGPRVIGAVLNNVDRASLRTVEISTDDQAYFL